LDQFKVVHEREIVAVDVSLFLQVAKNDRCQFLRLHLKNSVWIVYFRQSCHCEIMLSKGQVANFSIPSTATCSTSPHSRAWAVSISRLTSSPARKSPFPKLYNRKTPLTSADLLNDHQRVAGSHACLWP